LTFHWTAVAGLPESEAVKARLPPIGTVSLVGEMVSVAAIAWPANPNAHRNPTVLRRGNRIAPLPFPVVCGRCAGRLSAPAQRMTLSLSGELAGSDSGPFERRERGDERQSAGPAWRSPALSVSETRGNCGDCHNHPGFAGAQPGLRRYAVTQRAAGTRL
jgi:hypothetical protein